MDVLLCEMLAFFLEDALFGPRSEVELEGELESITELLPLQRSEIELKSLQLEYDCVRKSLQAETSLRFDFSIVLLALVLVLSVEHLRLHHLIQLLCQLRVRRVYFD